MNFIYRTMHPEIFHGKDKKAPFFEGWYFKLVSADEQHRFAFIPGMILGDDDPHSFVQVLNGNTAQSTYFWFPLKSFKADEKIFDVSIGRNRFNLNSLHFDIAMEHGGVSGEVKFGQANPWPVTPFAPGIMGPYSWVPTMECYHGLLSFDHSIEGELIINSKKIDFTGGRGYIEKDWGQSFPEAYVWMQTNHFQRPGVSLSASAAIIPWRSSAFPGYIVGLWLDGVLYPFATYNNTKLEKLKIVEDHVYMTLRNSKHRIEIDALRREGGLLKAPTKMDMGKRIIETMQASVSVKLTKLNGEIIFEGTGRQAGLEVSNHEKLEKMVK